MLKSCDILIFLFSQQFKPKFGHHCPMGACYYSENGKILVSCETDGWWLKLSLDPRLATNVVFTTVVSVATSDVLTSNLMFSENILMSDVLATNLMLS